MDEHFVIATWKKKTSLGAFLQSQFVEKKKVNGRIRVG
jgi:hypothetical protein